MNNFIAAAPPRRMLRALAVLTVLGALLGTGLTPRSAGDLQSQIAATRSATDSLKQQIAGDSRQIATTRNGIASAQARLTAIQGTLNQRVAQLKAVQTSLLAARDHLVELENRLHLATEALAANLVAGY